MEAGRPGKKMGEKARSQPGVKNIIGLAASFSHPPTIVQGDKYRAHLKAAAVFSTFRRKKDRVRHAAGHYNKCRRRWKCPGWGDRMIASFLPSHGYCGPHLRVASGRDRSYTDTTLRPNRLKLDALNKKSARQQLASFFLAPVYFPSGSTEQNRTEPSRLLD